jgi:hypothetical protein
MSPGSAFALSRVRLPTVDTWCLTSLDQEIINHEALVSVVLHSLLSCKGLFSGECADFVHLVSNSKGNGYLALCQIVCMLHPILGQTATQPSQPQQSKSQPFAEHVSNYIDYFQSEACLGHTYALHEQVILILGRLHPT